MIDERLARLAKDRGFECLSEKYEYSRSKYLWRCSLGHTWHASYNKIKMGRNCPHCALRIRSEKQRSSIEYVRAMADKVGVTFLSEEYVNAFTKYSWKCTNNHIFQAPANNIQQKKFCWECRNAKMSVLQRSRHPISKMIKQCEIAANERGGKFLGPYVAWNKNSRWECHAGHTWEAIPNNIKRKLSWCPECSIKNLGAQTEVYDFVKQFYPDCLFNKRSLLISKRLELDVYIPDIKKAIELDGEHWHSTELAQKRDLKKNAECKTLGIELLRIPYKECWQGKARPIGEQLIRDFLNVN